MADVIDTLASIAPDSPLDAIRANRPQARVHAQATYDSLFKPAREQLGARLAAALEHTHMLIFHPRDASPAHLQALIDAGWSTTGIVVISQLVAFLSYQIRVVTGLRVLTARSA